MPLNHRWPWILFFASACAATPAAVPPKDTSPRLVRVGDVLYVSRAPAGLKKDDLLYAMSADPVPGTSDHRKMGILRGVDRVGESLKVAWYTLIDEDLDADLVHGGLPVQMINQDLELRIGRHWGKYEPQPRSTFPGLVSALVLELNLGKDDGLEPGDQYAVLGEPRADALNRTVDSFRSLGTCTVLPFWAEATRAGCQVDRGLNALLFEEQHWIRGGYVRAITLRPAKTGQSIEGDGGT